jgi:hypothetical protein
MNRGIEFLLHFYSLIHWVFPLNTSMNRVLIDSYWLNAFLYPLLSIKMGDGF